MSVLAGAIRPAFEKNGHHRDWLIFAGMPDWWSDPVRAIGVCNDEVSIMPTQLATAQLRGPELKVQLTQTHVRLGLPKDPSSRSRESFISHI